jgi:hypothetical protein
MAHLTTEKITVKDGETNFTIKFDINITKEGEFTTTLSKDTVAILESALIKLSINQLGNKGYFKSDTKDGLIKQISDIAQEYVSKELISETIILNYLIRTTCSYAFDNDNNIVPNCSHQWIKREYKDAPDNYWKNGTKETNATNQEPYGLLVYVKPFVKREYQYKSGKTKVQYIHLCYGGEIAQAALDKGYNLRWLDDICSIAKPNGENTDEIIYTEENALFFVNIIKSICYINEKIKHFVKPEELQKLINSNIKLLG